MEQSSHLTKYISHFYNSPRPLHCPLHTLQREDLQITESSDVLNPIYQIKPLILDVELFLHERRKYKEFNI